MFNFNRNIVTALVGLSLTAVAATATASGPANPAPGTLGATITIQKSCKITASSQVDFGSVDPTTAGPFLGTGSISVECTKGTTITNIALDGGTNYDGSSTRQMKFGSNLVAYSLYTDSGRTTLWGDSATAGIGNVNTAPNLGAFAASSSATTPQTYTVYGKVLQAAVDGEPTGTYTDIVNVSVNY